MFGFIEVLECGRCFLVSEGISGSSDSDGGWEGDQSELGSVRRGSRLRDAVYPRPQGPGRGVFSVPAVVRAGRAHAEARDDRAVLHYEPRSAAPEVPAP